MVQEWFRSSDPPFLVYIIYAIGSDLWHLAVYHTTSAAQQKYANVCASEHWSWLGSKDMEPPKHGVCKMNLLMDTVWFVLIKIEWCRQWLYHTVPFRKSVEGLHIFLQRKRHRSVRCYPQETSMTWALGPLTQLEWPLDEMVNRFSCVIVCFKQLKLVGKGYTEYLPVYLSM